MPISLFLFGRDIEIDFIFLELKKREALFALLYSVHFSPLFILISKFILIFYDDMKLIHIFAKT